jgi:hypothetical protein
MRLHDEELRELALAHKTELALATSQSIGGQACHCGIFSTTRPPPLQPAKDGPPCSTPAFARSLSSSLPANLSSLS